LSAIVRSWRTRGANRIFDPTVILLGDAEVEEMMGGAPSAFVAVDILVEEISGDDRDEVVTHYGWRDRTDAPDCMPFGVVPRFRPGPPGAAEEFRAELIRAVEDIGHQDDATAHPAVQAQAASVIRAMRALSAPWMALDVAFISGSLMTATHIRGIVLPLLSDSDHAQAMGVGRRIALRVSVVRPQERALA
jgi:hypothetical protein